MAEAEFQLEARHALDGFEATIGKITLKEVVDQALVSIAIPKNGSSTLEKRLKTSLKCSWPKVGHSVAGKAGSAGITLLGLQADMAFAVFEHPGVLGESMLSDHLGGTAHLTEQSDAWSILEISGAASTSALERICPLDLSLEVFSVGSVHRTMMEHLGAIIWRLEQDRFWILGSISSAENLKDALVTSARNVVPYT